MKILVIDDDPAILDMYESVLLPADKTSDDKLVQQANELFDSHFTESKAEAWQSTLQIIKAIQGEIGIDCVKKEIESDLPIALAFIDVRMPPGMDGVETAKEILKIDPKIEIVFVTAYSDKTRQDMEATLHNRRFFYLRKPHHPDELLQMAQSLLMRWETARDRERLDEEKSIFEANMSHELRHPLQIIKGVCGTLLKFDMDKNRQKQFLNDIQSETERLINFVEKLQVLKTDQKKNLNPVKIDQVIDRVIRLLTKDAEKKQLSLSKKGAKNLPDVKGDESGLTQVLINLIVNAISYTEKGRIIITTNLQKNSIEIQIKDTGVGISAEDQKRICNRYYRVKDQSLKTRGHGLGLNIVADILKAHDSTLEIDSTPGEGSTFSFSLKCF